MRILYAVDFSSCLCSLIFRLRKPYDRFAFFVMLAINAFPSLGRPNSGLTQSMLPVRLNQDNSPTEYLIVQ